jgi:hypothetical protein
MVHLALPSVSVSCCSLSAGCEGEKPGRAHCELAIVVTIMPPVSCLQRPLAAGPAGAAVYVILCAGQLPRLAQGVIWAWREGGWRGWGEEGGAVLAGTCMHRRKTRCASRLQDTNGSFCRLDNRCRDVVLDSTCI